MNISGIQHYSGFYDDTVTNRMRPDSAGTEATAAAESAVSSEQTGLAAAQDAVGGNRQTFGAYDYAKQYRPESVYDLKGTESDLRNLDVQNAISNMQKDQAIQQYQFFVGDQQVLAASATAARGGEDFSL